jgi:hypothetical protein
MIEQQRNLRRSIGGHHRAQIGQIRFVERNDVIELHKIFGCHKPGAERGDIDPMCTRHGLRPRIGSFAQVPVTRPRAVDRHFDSARLHLAPERGFGEGRPADIPQTDEQDARFHTLSLLPLMPRLLATANGTGKNEPTGRAIA